MLLLKWLTQFNFVIKFVLNKLPSMSVHFSSVNSCFYSHNTLVIHRPTLTILIREFTLNFEHEKIYQCSFLVENPHPIYLDFRSMNNNFYFQ